MTLYSGQDCGVLTIDLSALAANYKALSAKAPQTQIAAVVKADAYGLGLEPIAKQLAQANCTNFFVAQIAEAIQLRALLKDATIYVLNGLTQSPDVYVQNNLIPCLASLEQIKLWRSTGKPAALMLDIGFNRLGLSKTDILDLADAPDLLAGWELKMIIGHLACSDNPDHTMNRAQAEAFRDASALLPPAPLSLANSGGLLLGADYHFDMARIGIALYGGIEDPELRPVATLAAPILQIRTLSQGESVGYSASFVAAEDMTIGIVALGYGDGIPHHFGTQTAPIYLAHNDAPVPIIGRISMDTLAVDLSNLPRPAACGDMIEVFGAHSRLAPLAKAGNTTAYELLTRLGKRSKRLYV